MLKALQKLSIRNCSRSQLCQFSEKVEHPPHPSPDPRLGETYRNFLDPQEFCNYLLKSNIRFFTGVPDSLLRNFCAYISGNVPREQNIIAANEGLAMSLGAGHYLATGETPLIYMQNSGLGNCVNPYLSLMHKQIYSIPALLLIGWRGEPGKKDEPQHFVQGKLTDSLLTTLGISFEILPDYIEGAMEAVDSAVEYMKRRQQPFAFICKRQTFLDYEGEVNYIETYPQELLNRESGIELVMSSADEYAAVVGSTGFASREIYEYRVKNGMSGSHDFLCVGSMGHASSIATGISLAKTSRQVICIDGDGAALMHLGALTTIGQLKPKNLIHVIFNNGAHESVGGQPTAGSGVHFANIAKAVGYAQAFTVSTPEQIKQAMADCGKIHGPTLIEIRVKCDTRTDLGRPKTKPIQNKEEFIKFLTL